MNKKKKLAIGAYSIGLTAVVVAVVIALNLLVGQLPAVFTKLDASPDKLITIGADTKTVLKGIKDDVTIYHISTESGEADPNLEGMLERYASASSKIKLATVDPLKEPAFTKKYTDATLANHSLIVVSEKRSTVVDSSKFYQYEVDGYEGQYLSYADYNYYAQQMAYYGQSVSATEYFFAENEITRALDYVSHDALPVVYELSGHKESSLLSAAMGGIIADENVELKSLELLKGETVAVPEDATAVILNVPQTDITTAEKDALISYLDRGGQVILSTYVSLYTAEKMPNLALVCSHMGLKAIENYVFESNTDGYSQYPFYLLPSVTGKGVTAPLAKSGLYTYMIESHAIVTTGENANITAYPLLETTSGAYLYTEEMEKDPENTELVDKAQKAVRSLAYQSTISDGEGNAKGSLYWFASPYFFTDNFVGYGNSEILITLLTDICDKPTAVSVIGKAITQSYMQVTETDSLVWTVTLVGALPLISIIAGFAVWYRRRSR